MEKWEGDCHECTRNEKSSAWGQSCESVGSKNVEAYYVKTKEEALEKALELIPKGSSVSWGGTMWRRRSD